MNKNKFPPFYLVLFIGFFLFNLCFLGAGPALAYVKTNSTGQIDGKWAERSFGQRLPIQEFSTPYGFTGREFEESLGLNFHRARFYDPGIGRFISKDPVFGDITNPITQHPYLYGNLNPYRFVDPWGHASIYIVDTEGVKYSRNFTTYLEFENILKKYADSPNKIQRFEYIGHGGKNSTSLDFHDFPTFFNEKLPSLFPLTGGVYIGARDWAKGRKYRNLSFIRDLIKNSFLPNATIELKACKSASKLGENELTFAKELKRILPESTITGYEGYIRTIPYTRTVFRAWPWDPPATPLEVHETNIVKEQPQL